MHIVKGSPSWPQIGNLLSANSNRVTVKPFDETTLPSVHDLMVPSQSYFESFEERLRDGRLKADTSPAKRNHRSTCSLTNQLDSTVDINLTKQTRKRCISTMPSDTKERCKKYCVMTHLWLLAQVRQPGRNLYGDLTLATFRSFLDELLSEDNSAMNKEINGVIHTAPLWSHCLQYEFQLRT